MQLRRRSALLIVLAGVAVVAGLAAAPAPAIAHSCSSITPGQVIRGENNQTVHLNGSYPFPNSPPETVSISPDTGITIVSTTTMSSSLIDIVVNVAPTAPTTPRTITVSQVSDATCAGDLDVGPPLNVGPTLTSITPVSGAGGTVVAITDLRGNDFEGTPTVALERSGFAPIPMTNVARPSTTKVTGNFDLTEAAPGKWSVRLTNPGGATGVLANGFTVERARPSVTDVTPESVVQGASGVKLTINGTGFAPGFVLTMPDAGGAVLSNIVRMSTSVIEAEIAVASNAVLGSRDLVVTNADNQSGECTACLFVVDGEQVGRFSSFNAYGTFDKGAFVAAGSLDGLQSNGAEIVSGANAGGGPHVQVFRINPSTGAHAELVGFYAYSPAFDGGVRVAVGELDGNTANGSEIVTAPGPGGGPHVRIFKVNPDLSLTEPLGNGFMAYSPQFGGGVYVATGDVDGDGRDEIIVGAGPGGGPHVRVMKFDPATRGFRELAGFYAYAAGFDGGVTVAGGNVVPEESAPAAEVITAPASAGGPHVRVFDRSTALLGEFFAYEADYEDGVRVGAGDIDFDTVDDIVVGRAVGGEVALFSEQGGDGFALLIDPPTKVYGATFSGGINVASFDMDGDGDDDLVTAPDHDSVVVVRVTRLL